MSNSNTVFDFSKLFTQFDPKQYQEQLQSVFKAFQPANVDVKALMEVQKANIEALTAANKLAVEGAQELFQLQTKLFQEAMQDATDAANALAKSHDPSEVAEQQTELMQQALEKTVRNSKEISELIRKNQSEVTAKVYQRVTENLAELKDSLAQKKA